MGIQSYNVLLLISPHRERQ